MSKCECWHETPGHKWVDAECWGTRERDACSCGGDQTKCDFYPEVRERANNQGTKSVSLECYKQMRWERDVAIGQLNNCGIGFGEKFWHDAKQDPPKQNGKYLICYNVLGNNMFQVVNYALDLAEAEPIDFEDEHHPGWYEYDSEYGYVECHNVLYWAKIPDAPRRPDACPECGAEFNRRPDIQAAIAHYNRGINEDIFSPEVATYARLAVEALRKMEVQ